MSDIYERLRERLDMFPQGFPQTQSGVEIEVLKTLFTPEEAEMMFSLRPYPEDVPKIAERAGGDVEGVGDLLYDMSKKGLILRATLEDQRFYMMAPWMIGIWEFQLKNLTPDNIPLYERFYQEGIVPARKNIKMSGFRVIPIEREIEGGTEIEPYERVSQIIDTSSQFAVADCICRKEAHIMGHGCDKLVEACMMFDFAAQYYIENGLGREITREEAHEILRKTEEEGLVHCSGNHKDKKMFICNCCGCCCKAMAFVTKHDMPSAIAHSNYYAAIDPDTCTACETCLDRCQVTAIKMDDETAVIDRDRCIGCGLCVSTCPTESITLVRKTPEEASPVFENQTEFLQTLGRENNKIYPFE